MFFRKLTIILALNFLFWFPAFGLTFDFLLTYPLFRKIIDYCHFRPLP
jgi:hypothetical protein